MIIFILPPLVGVGDVLWYRRVEFWREALHLARPFLPSYTLPYEEVMLIGAEAAKAGDRVNIWKLMGNCAELRSRFQRLAQVDAMLLGEQASDEELQKHEARQHAMTISVGVFMGLSAGIAVPGLDLG